MFGYVNVCKDELKIKDYNLWKSYYCGLCKCLGKRYNNIIRLGLNYDIHDDKSIKAAAASVPYLLPLKKAKNLCCADKIKERLDNIALLEKKNCKDARQFYSPFGE